MWATLNQLSSQPVLEFVPDQPERVHLPQYVRNNSGDTNANPDCLINPGLTDGPPITLESLVENIHAVHVVLGMEDEPDFSFCLGDRYRLTISTFSNSDPLHPFMGVGQAAVRARIEDNGADVASADLPFIPATPAWNFFVSGLSVCFGYARNDAGQLKAYANISYFGQAADCGSKTANLIATVDEQDALPGKMKIVVRHGFVGFRVMACKIGPFEKAEPHVLETTDSKKARAGDRVASLRSKASNFSSPAHFRATTARVDCGGHSEFLGDRITFGIPLPFVAVCLFAPSLAGQPDADTAYVACSDSWRSNCGFSLAHARKASAIRVQATRLAVLPPFFSMRVATFDISMESNSYGNNEYAGTAGNEPRDGIEVRDYWDTIHAAAQITGFEDVEDPFDSPLSAVRPRTRFTVTVTVFASKEGERAAPFGSAVGTSVSKTLTEQEAVAFFEGGTISLADGTLSITAVGG
jgi:hypothetical protein